MTNEAIIYIVAIFSVSGYFYYAGTTANQSAGTFQKNTPLPINFKLIYALAIATIAINTLFSKGGGLTVVVWGYLLWNIHKRDIAGTVKTAKINFYVYVALMLVGCIGMYVFEKDNGEIQQVVLKALFALGVIGGVFLHSIYFYIEKFSQCITNAPTDTRKNVVTNEKFYEIAFEELSTESRRNGLWAVAIANNNGDENKAKAEYINKRVQEMIELQNPIETATTNQSTGNVESAFVKNNPALFFFIVPAVVLLATYIFFFDKNLVANLLDGDKKTFVAVECNKCTEDGCKKADELKSIEVDVKAKTFRIYYTNKSGEMENVLRGVNENCAFPTNEKFTFGCVGSSTSNVADFNLSSRSTTNFDGTYFNVENYARTDALPERLVFRQQCRMK
ncbi:MAG: hypothetical protein RI975_925 [Pseudomonadota bacterium]|jgi:hypothetical protein